MVLTKAKLIALTLARDAITDVSASHCTGREAVTRHASRYIAKESCTARAARGTADGRKAIASSCSSTMDKDKSQCSVQGEYAKRSGLTEVQAHSR